MTKLEDLQKEAREELYDFPGKSWLDTTNVSISHGKLCELLDTLTARAFRAGMEEAKECVVELDKGKADDSVEDNAITYGWNQARFTTLAALDQKISEIV